MSAVAPEVVSPPAERDSPARRRFDRALWWDLGAALGYLALAGFVTFRVLAGLGTKLVNSVGGFDQVLFEWMLAHAARSVTHLENPFYTERLNVPDGMNMMANTSALGLGIPMTPVTLLSGTHVSYLVLLVGSMAATGWAWYFVLSRHLVRSRVAAALGGAFCAFAPGMVSTAIHLHVLAQFSRSVHPAGRGAAAGAGSGAAAGCGTRPRPGDPQPAGVRGDPDHRDPARAGGRPGRRIGVVASTVDRRVRGGTRTAGPYSVARHCGPRGAAVRRRRDVAGVRGRRPDDRTGPVAP
jgi:hypothetical protein